MAKSSREFIIKFGPDDQTIQGMSLEDALKEEEARLKTIPMVAENGRVVGVVAEVSDEQREYLRKNRIESVRDGEKGILRKFLEAYVVNREKGKFDIGDLNQASDVVRDLDSDEDHLLLMESELDMIRKGYERVDEETHKRYGAVWLKFGDLLSQIMNPEQYVREEPTPTTPGPVEQAEADK